MQYINIDLIDMKKNHAPSFMKVKKYLNTSEAKTARILHSTLNGTGFTIEKKVLLRNIIECETCERLSKKEQSQFEKGEFDFVVFDSNGLPVFAIEFDGPCHEFSKSQEKDIAKNSISHKAKVPLLRITDIFIKESDRHTILEFIIERFLAWNREFHAHLERIEEFIGDLSTREIDELTKNGFADPSIDPSFLFDIDHPFSGTIDVANRLLNKYQVFWHGLPQSRILEISDNLRSKVLYCITISGAGYLENNDIIVDCSYIIFQNRNYSDPIHRDKIRFRIRAVLPIERDFDPSKESPFEYWKKTGKFPISIQELPGISSTEVAENISEYMALRMVEEWAATNAAQTSLKKE